MSENISRRSFLKGTAAGAAGLAATTLLAGIGTSQTPEVEPTSAPKSNKGKDKRKTAAFIKATDVKAGGGTGKIRYRWNGCVFNEIILPNGKEIVLDPYWYGIDNQYIADNTVEAGKWIKGADYMILTHTHGDHVADTPSVLDWYPFTHVICPIGGLAEYANAYGLGATRYCLHGVSNGDKLEFEDFTLEVFGGRHTFNTKEQVLTQMDNEILTNKRYLNSDGTFNAQTALNSQWGGLHFCNYMITTKPEGFKILIYGGMLNYDPYKYSFVGSKPDMMFYQAANPNLGNPYYGTRLHINLDENTIKTDDLAAFVASCDAGFCMPSHQEKFSMDMLNLIGQRCSEAGVKAGIHTQYFIPAHNTWYTIDKDKDGNVIVNTTDKEPEKRKDPQGISVVNS